MKNTYVFREAWPYHFDPLFDWISALPICSSAKLLLACIHNNNRTLGAGQTRGTGAINLSLEARGNCPGLPPGQLGRDQMACRIGILRSCQLRVGLLDTPSPRVLPGDPHHPFH